MSELELTRQRFEDLKCCVIIPTYNNDRTLERVIREVGLYTENIIIVNDGSTDGTAEILRSFPNYSVITNPKNKGKGYSLKTAFRHAIGLGYRYAITIDSDSQHYPEDLPKFLEKITQSDGLLVIGARSMSQDGVPATSSFGHRFSIFWFRVETGQRIPDVQSGYRLYPLDNLKGMRFVGGKYEFEVEVLVRLAWRGVCIDSIPVNVFLISGNSATLPGSALSIRSLLFLQLSG
jgi:glycosyltransferase involved in cell wall biosynthesis